MDPQKPKCYWTDEKLLEEYRKVCEENGGWPSREIWHSKYQFLYQMIYRGSRTAEYYRKKLGVEHVNYKNKTCEKCGSEFKPSGPNWSRQRFCSNECKIDFHRIKQNERSQLKIKQEKVCPICAKTFIPKTTTKQKYCERECFVKFRKRLDKALRTCLEYLGEDKISTSSVMLGYNPQQLLEHLETFPTWTTLKSTKWHLDHIFPVIAFIDKGIKDVSLICCLENLQPLASKSNLSKASKYDKKAFELWLETKYITSPNKN